MDHDLVAGPGGVQSRGHAALPAADDQDRLVDLFLERLGGLGLLGPGDAHAQARHDVPRLQGGGRCRFGQPCSRLVGERGLKLGEAFAQGLGGRGIACSGFDMRPVGGPDRLHRSHGPFGGRHVTVNAIAPGFFPSKMTRVLLEEHREAFEQARIELERASDNLALIREGRIAGRGETMESIIRAPAAGIVLEREVDPGDPVVPLTSFQEGTELASIADMSDLIFKGTVDEIDVGKIAVGMQCRIKVGALPDDVVTGRLSRIAPQAQKAEGATLFDVEIELDPNQEVTLRAGYSANADVVIREKTDIVLIPERLVLFEDDKTFVEFPGAGPEAEPQKVEVELGLSDGLNVEIVSGVADGDRIVQRPPREIS